MERRISVGRVGGWLVNAATWVVSPSQAGALALAAAGMIAAILLKLPAWAWPLVLALTFGAGLWTTHGFFKVRDRWREHRRVTDIAVADTLRVVAAPVKNSTGNRVADVWSVSFRIAVRNSRPNKQTLRRATAYLHAIFVADQPLPCCSGGWEADIRHGETAYFELARMLSKHLIGVPEIKAVTVPDEELETALSNLACGHSLFVAAPGTSAPLNIAFPKELPHDTHVMLYVTVSADDARAAVLNIRVNGRKFPDLNVALELEVI